MIKVCHLFIYPIKACQTIAINEAVVTLKGLAGDRQLMWIDSTGQFVTQRTYPQLAQVQVQQLGKTLKLSVETGEIQPFELEPTLTGRAIPVKIWRDDTVAIDQGDQVAEWLKQALKLEETFRLVQQSPDYLRLVDPNYAVKSDNHVSFADGYPCLLTNTASLDDLNRRLAENYSDSQQQISMNRFRPNIVIESDQPFIEDSWKSILIGEVYFDLVKPCSRCIVTTTHQKSGERNELKEPLKTLATFRQQPRGVMFGFNTIPRNTGKIQVGDCIEVVETQ